MYILARPVGRPVLDLRTGPPYRVLDPMTGPTYRVPPSQDWTSCCCNNVTDYVTDHVA